MESIPLSSIPLLINKRFRLDPRKQIGKGSFGMIFLVTDIQTNKDYAAKLEKKTKNDLLSYEHHILSQIQSETGFTRVQFYGEQDGFLILIFDLLGRNLEERFDCCNRRFSIETVAHIGIQCLTRLEQLHQMGYLHRDIKPENFVFGRDDKLRQVFLIDFGLSKRYVDRSTKEHIPFRTGKSLTGTPRYATIPAHLGVEQGRRDDLESLGYVLLYFLKGTLPWQGIRCSDAERKYRMICEQKMRTPIERLCSHCPMELVTYFTYTMSLQMATEPNYGFLRNLLFQMAQTDSIRRSKRNKPQYSTQQHFLSTYEYEWLEGMPLKQIMTSDLSDASSDPPTLQPPPKFAKIRKLGRESPERRTPRPNSKIANNSSSNNGVSNPNISTQQERTYLPRIPQTNVITKTQTKPQNPNHSDSTSNPQMSPNPSFTHPTSSNTSLLKQTPSEVPVGFTLNRQIPTTPETPPGDNALPYLPKLVYSAQRHSSLDYSSHDLFRSRPSSRLAIPSCKTPTRTYSTPSFRTQPSNQVSAEGRLEPNRGQTSGLSSPQTSNTSRRDTTLSSPRNWDHPRSPAIVHRNLISPKLPRHGSMEEISNRGDQQRQQRTFIIAASPGPGEMGSCLEYPSPNQPFHNTLSPHSSFLSPIAHQVHRPSLLKRNLTATTITPFDSEDSFADSDTESSIPDNPHGSMHYSTFRRPFFHLSPSSSRNVFDAVEINIGDSSN